MLRDITRPNINLTSTNNGIIQFYDYTRDKLLSVNRETMSFGIDHRNITGKRWLRVNDKINTYVSGYKIIRNATITAISIHTQNIVDEARFSIRLNNSTTNIHTSSISASQDIIEDNLNYNINKDDFLQLFMSVLSGDVDFPIVTVEIAWR